MAWTTKPLGGGVKSLVVRPLKKTLFYVCLPLACRHHVWETHLKHFWEQYSPDKTTTGPNNPLFKALRDNWDQFNSKETSLTRFDWNNSGQWIRAQAQEAKQFFRMIITTGAFRNAEVRELAKIIVVWSLRSKLWH